MQCADDEKWFQFLLGTLKTPLSILYLCCSLVFQFLLGTLKTARQADFSTFLYRVSIPLRYAKNAAFTCNCPAYS